MEKSGAALSGLGRFFTACNTWGPPQALDFTATRLRDLSQRLRLAHVRANKG